MNRLALVLLAAMSVGPAPASAQVIDLSSIRCSEFFEGPQERIRSAVTWLDGYYQGEDEPPVVDFDRIRKKTDALAGYCANHPTHGIITAADEVLGK